MSTQRKPWKNWVLFLASLVVVFLLGLLVSSITERKMEAKFAYKPLTEINKLEPRNEVWGENFPREFQSYSKTEEGNFRSKYNGSEEIDMLEEDPRLVVLWAGYGFAKDYNQGRGHEHAIEDLRATLRTGAPTGPDDGPMPSTCWTCKSPDVPRLINEIGVNEYYSGKWASKGEEVVNPIGCANCHDEKSMNLTITQPALIEAFARQGKDISKASHNDMRSLVCAQCHSEYYFNKNLPNSKGVPYLVFPWDEGQTVEDMEKYYDNVGHVDWTHKISRAPMLKAQHPGYEVFKMGIHGQRGVSCSDCHMPYKTEGGQKFTDHHIQSPLNNVANSCQVCHREEKEELIKNVFDNQDRIIGNRDQLERLLVRAHVEAGKCWELGASEAQMKDILHGIRLGQWRWDYAAASHGGSFHAPVETGRVIGTGIDITQETRIKLAKLLMTLGFNGDVPYPAIETKEAAQKFIGLPIEKMEADKARFLKELAPKWDEAAKKREANY
ncbi:MAG: ammonia-forming cytochrome c nitrite reductase [Lutibacter sp.]|uniref:ammonia-forming cytochrome c nitrite reductase n=1 Tax=Lutibacter sp. TaxID=1925666 RepID=UPI001A02FEB4|nr:ammonia-forming cytochrome c nitrite reductase [Lutibacter sp.]NOR28432.1 ammonia-forming cytochrome c nitrite reductase [Lutibacter sp.]